MKSFVHFTPYGQTRDSIACIPLPNTLNIPEGKWLNPVGARWPLRLTVFECQYLESISDRCLKALRWKQKRLKLVAASSPVDSVLWHPWYSVKSLAAQVGHTESEVLVSIQIKVLYQADRGDVVRFEVAPGGGSIRARKSGAQTALAVSALYPEPVDDTDAPCAPPAKKPFMVRI